MRISRISVILASLVWPRHCCPRKASQGRNHHGGTPTGGTTGGTNGTPSTGNLPSLPGTNTNNTSTQYPTSAPRGAFYFGKVVMPDGTAPPAGVIIERVCNGSPHPQAYTDSRGDFSFQVGQTQDMLPDASETAGGRPYGLDRR